MLNGDNVRLIHALQHVCANEICPTIKMYPCSNYAITLLPCAVESHPTPGDSRDSSSPSRSISGVSSHVADGGSARIPHECVQPSLS